jgi:hypothetical protein
MSILTFLLVQLFFCFIGFTIGRFGDKYLGYLDKIGGIPVPHHWIWGVLMIILGIFFHDSVWAMPIISFGIGHFISDLNDFLHLRFVGEDPPHEWKFWNID